MKIVLFIPSGQCGCHFEIERYTLKNGDSNSGNSMKVDNAEVGSATFVTFKFNDGESAIICGKCRKIIKEGKDFTDEEIHGMKNSNLLPAQFCGECRD